LEFGGHGDVGCGSGGAKFHSEDFGAPVKDEVPITDVQVRKFVVFFRADICDGSQVPGAIASNHFVLSDGLDGPLAQREEFFAEFCELGRGGGVFFLEGFDEGREGFDFGPIALDIGEDGSEFDELLFFGHMCVFGLGRGKI